MSRGRAWWFHLHGLVNPRSAAAADGTEADDDTDAADGDVTMGATAVAEADEAKLRWLGAEQHALWACPGGMQDAAAGAETVAVNMGAGAGAGAGADAGVAAATAAPPASPQQRLDEHMAATFDTVDRFLLSSTLGEFTTRLDLVHAFCAELRQAAADADSAFEAERNRRMAHLLANLHSCVYRSRVWGWGWM